MAYSLLNLSTSANGSPIQITGTGPMDLSTNKTLTNGQIIHSGVADTSSFDEIFLYATNRADTGVYLMLQWGAVTSGSSIQATIYPKEGLNLISPGLILNSGSILRAYASSGNAISVMGYVQRGP